MSAWSPVPAPPASLPAVEGITIGRTVSLDPRAWRRHESDSFFGLDAAELAITAQGYIALDPGNHVHRFYTDEEIMFQAVSRAPDGTGADDLTIFHGLWSHHPATWQREQFLQRMRRSIFEHEGVTWDRFWYAGYENEQEPVRLIESLFEDRSGRPVREVVQTCMLYSRPLAAGGNELLLAMEIEADGGGIVQELMVGIALDPAEFNV